MLLTNLTLDNNMAETIAKSPYIDYKWSSHTRANGDRELFDYGKSHSNGKLHFGRGIKFNGVDQSVTAYIPEFKTVIYTITAGSDATHYHIDCGTSCGIFWVVGSKPTVYYSGTNHNVNMLLEEDKTYTIAYVKTTSSVEAYINGSKVAEFEATTQVFGMHATTIGSESGMDDTVSNVIFINNVLTPQQIEYQYKYPEKFLYHEKTVNADGSATWEAKSKILTQDDLNSVVAHLPMCENDLYVRDMIGYSEDVNLTQFPLLNWTISNDGGDSSITENADGSIVIDYVASDNVYLNIQQAVAVTNVPLKVRIVVDSIVGEIKVQDSDTDGSFGRIFEAGTYEFVSISNQPNIIIARNNGGVDTDAVISSFEIVELSNTTPITNPTNDMLLTNQTNGLQTCFLERDELGVITGGSFDSITSNSVADYSITNNFSLENVTNIEFIYEADSSLPKYNYNKLLYIGQGNTSFFRVERLGVGGTLYSVVNTQNTQQYFSFPDDTPIHINYYINQSTNELSLFVNGIIVGDVEALDDPINTEICDLYLMNNNYLSRSIMGNIRLFKIHTTPQDPLELYNKAISTGKFGDVRSKAYIDAGTFDLSKSGERTIIERGTNV